MGTSLFSSCKIGTCEIKNRIVMTAANLGWCRDGFVTEEVADFYRERAKGQAGLVIAGAAGVDPKRMNQAGMMQICKDFFIPPMKKLTDAVHQEGGRIFLQLMHAGAYARKDEHGGIPAVAPSSYYCRFTRETAKELSAEEIAEIVTYFKEAAVRAKAAGFDGIELMGSAGYLIAEFLSKATNRRSDRYGGDVEGRSLFLIEILRAVREAAGKDYPVIVRLSGSDFIPHGNSYHEFLEIGTLIEEWADAIDVTGGWHESGVPQITGNVPRGMYLYLAKAMKDTVNIPVIGCNRLDAGTAVYAVEQGYCDMAGMLRGLIADPFLPRKRKEGNQEAIRPCLACNQGCLEPIFSGGRAGCVVNPHAGREGKILQGKESRKSILVIGAGVSGMAYAALASLENKVTVWEKGLEYGGLGRALARVPGKETVKEYLDYLFSVCIHRGVEFQWGRAGDGGQIRELLKSGEIDRVVIAAGSAPEMPDCEIAEYTAVVSEEDCIMGKTRIGRNIVITGAGSQAVQTALCLAKTLKWGQGEQEFLGRYVPEHQKFAENVMKWEPPSITLLTSAQKAGGGLGKSIRFMMLEEIERNGIQVITEATIRRVEQQQVKYLKGGKEYVLWADMIVAGNGRRKNDRLLSELSEFAGKVEIIGDARKPGRIAGAVKSAFAAAMIEGG